VRQIGNYAVTLDAVWTCDASSCSDKCGLARKIFHFS